MTTNYNDCIKKSALASFKILEGLKTTNDGLLTQVQAHSNSLHELIADFEATYNALRRNTQVLTMAIQGINAKIDKDRKELQKIMEDTVFNSVMAQQENE